MLWCIGAQGYLYSLCPFKEVKQDKHSLGRWKGWGAKGGALGGGYQSMLFDGGSRCHNNKQRCVCVRGCGCVYA